MKRSLFRSLAGVLAIGAIAACGDKLPTDASDLSTDGSTSAITAHDTLSPSSAWYTGFASSVSVSLASSSIAAGQQTQAKATLRDGSGNVLPSTTVTWKSSNNAVATVASTGMVKAVGTGSATITGTRLWTSGSATMTVTGTSGGTGTTAGPIASVNVSLATSALKPGQVTQATAVALDASKQTVAGATSQFGSTDTTVAKVTLAGAVTALKAGTTEIKAISGGIIGGTTLTVSTTTTTTPPPATTAPVASVSVSLSAASLPVGGTVQATAVARDASSNVLTGRAVTWASSNTSVATISTTGAISGRVAGSAVITATSEGKASTATVSVTAVSTPPTTPPAAGTAILFQDSFESGGFTTKQNGVSWTSNAYVDVSPAIAHSGSRAVRFRQGESIAAQGGHDAWSELRFGGLPNLKEAFIQFYIYYPSGAESPSVGPRVKVTETRNDKFFRLWGNTDGDYGALPGNKVGASLFGDGGGSNATMGVEYQFSDPAGQWGMGEGPDAAPHPRAAFLTDARRGRWVQMRIRAKVASAANNDGVVQVWADGSLILSRTNLQSGSDPSIGAAYKSATANSYTTGYLLGWLNNGAQPGQMTYIDDVVISSGGFAQ